MHAIRCTPAHPRRGCLLDLCVTGARLRLGGEPIAGVRNAADVNLQSSEIFR